MKITIYELLGLIKDGKQPKIIKFCGNIYKWEDDWYLTKEKKYSVCLGGKKEDHNILINAFNENVEIIEEDKEIKKLDYCEKNTFSNMKETTYLSCEERRLLDSNFKTIKEKFDELIDEVNRLKNN